MYVGHVDDAFVAVGAADVGETDSGVAGSSLDNGPSGLDPACTRPHRQLSAGMPQVRWTRMRARVGARVCAARTGVFCPFDEAEGRAVLD